MIEADAIRRRSWIVAAGLVAAGLALGLRPAAAAHTPWVDNEGGRIRLVATPPDAQGTIRAALAIDLKPGWTTYWRNPGAAGIPPSIMPAGSINAGDVAVSYPLPRALDEGGVAAIGYDRSVALPITVRQQTPGAPSTLSFDVFLGVCNRICVPVQAQLQLPISGGPGGTDEDTIRIAEAFARLPEKPSRDFAVRSARLSADGAAIAVTVTLPDVTTKDTARLFLAGPDGFAFGSPETGAAAGGTDAAVRFTVPILQTPKGERLADKPVHIVVSDGFRSMATETTVE